MRIWVDDIRTPPEGYIWVKSVNDAIDLIRKSIDNDIFIELIDMDHDAGDFSSMGGDYIRLLDWLEIMEYNFPIRIHSMNPVGVQNMRLIIQKNNWEEVR